MANPDLETLYREHYDVVYGFVLRKVQSVAVAEDIVQDGAQTETRQPDGTVPAFDPPAEWVVRITAQAKEAGCRVHWKPNLRRSLWFNEYPEGMA